MESYKIPRHRVFISFYNADEYYKNYLIKLNEYNYDDYRYQSIFEDFSVGYGEIDDTYLTDEQVRKIIRDDYIKDATVLILLCGEKTKTRKFIDWELHAAMFETDNKPKLGIIVINLPSIENKQCVRLTENEKKVVKREYNWFQIDSRKMFEEKYPYMPDRIIDNFESGLTNKEIVYISVADWDTIANDNEALKTLIDDAFQKSRDKEKHYNHSSPLRRRNS